MVMEDGVDLIRAQFETGNLIDQLPSLIWTSLPDRSIDFVNRRWCEFTGLNLDHARGADWISFFHADDIPNLSENWRSLQNSGQSGGMEARLRSADRGARRFLINLSPSTDSAGRVTKWCAVAVDVEDRLTRSDQTHSIQNDFRLIVDSIPVPVAVTTPTGEVEALNQATLDYFGKSFEELKGWKSSDVVHPDDLEPTAAAQIKSHQTGTSYNVESRHLRFDGVYRWFNVIGLPLKDKEGRILRWLHLQIDVDDRKRAEEALAARERDLQLVTDTIPGLMWSADEHGQAEFFNSHYLDYLGCSESEARGSGWLAAVHPDDLEGLLSTWRRIMASARPGEAEARLRRHDGQYRWFLFRTNPALDVSGEPVKWYGINTDIEDLKRGEELLRESEQRFRTLFEEAGAGITILDLEPGGPIQTNRAMRQMLDCREEELRAVESFTALTAEEDREADLDLFVELRQGKRESLRQEKHFILNDGRSVWAKCTFTLLRDSSGKPKSVISIYEDITEQKLALHKLQAYQELLDLAQKSAGAMAFDWYTQKEINYWSPEQEGLFGLAPGTFDGTFKTWKKMMYAPDWPTVVAAIQRANETGVVEAEYRVVWPDGSLHWLSTNGRMFFNEAGEPFRMVGFTSDVTRRKLVEEELKRSEAFLTEGQNLARMGNFSWDVDAEKIIWSEQLYRIFEFEPGEPLTMELIAARVHPEDFVVLHEMVDRARQGVSDFEYEHRLLMPDDSVKYLHMIAHRNQDVSARLEYLGAVQDVTQRRLSEEALNEARSELARAAGAMSLGVLTAAIAHEVNQPLSGIITNANTCVRMLDADPPNIEGARETARRTIRDGNRASEVIARLRALFGRKGVTPELLDLNEVAREVLALSWSDLRRENLILQTDFTEDSTLVEADRVQLQQVIMNLLRNASDAMRSVEGRPRRLLIATERAGGQIVLRVKDSGIGLDPSAANKLFNAFYTTKDDGMGIGLSVSKSIIESHRGRLWATPNDGPGATFSFSLNCLHEEPGESIEPEIPRRANI